MGRAYNSTIRVKEKPCIRCGKPCVWFSKKRCQTCAKIEQTLARDEKELEKIIDEEDLGTLIQDADRVVSLYVRLKHSDKDGNCKCFTCSTVLPYKQMQAGHYIRRSHLLLRWDTDRNIRPQCENCNCYHHGRLAVFAQNLEKEKPGLPDILLEESTIVYKPSRHEIRQIISEYTQKLEQLKQSI